MNGRGSDVVPAAAPGATADVVRQLRQAGCVFAEAEAALLLAGGGDVAGRIARRVAGEPLEQVLGWAQFCGLRVAVEPGVFVPRRRTELLAVEAARLAARVGRPAPGAGRRVVGKVVVVDLCCGSGAVALVVGRRVPNVELHAADLDPVAVRCARGNLATVDGRVHEGDLFTALPPGLRGRVSVLAANAPYVPTAAIASMPREAREHEPRATLDGGQDGVDLHRRIAAGAREWLVPGGWLLVETSPSQVRRTAAAFRAGGLTARAHRDPAVGGVVVAGRVRPGVWPR